MNASSYAICDVSVYVSPRYPNIPYPNLNLFQCLFVFLSSSRIN